MQWGSELSPEGWERDGRTLALLPHGAHAVPWVVDALPSRSCTPECLAGSRCLPTPRSVSVQGGWHRPLRSWRPRVAPAALRESVSSLSAGLWTAVFTFT